MVQTNGVQRGVRIRNSYRDDMRSRNSDSARRSQANPISLKLAACAVHTVAITTVASVFEVVLVTASVRGAPPG